MMMIVSYTLLVNSLLLEDVVASYTPEIWSARSVNTRCVLGENQCDSDIPELRMFMTMNLNVKRSYIARGLVSYMPIATNMMMLENDERLNYEAQKYVEDCIRTYGMPERCPKPDETKGNISISVQSYNTKRQLERETNREAAGRISEVLQQWGNHNNQDISKFVTYFDSSRVDERLLDFFKIAHARVWKVGCGIADYFYSKEDFQEIIACFYGPPPLRDGEELYKSGSVVCNDCPSEASCLKTDYYHGGLCKVWDVNSFTYGNLAPSPVSSTSPEGPVVSTSPPYTGPEDDAGTLIWECDLKDYSGECIVERSCAPHWTVNRIEGFKYINVSGRCVTASVFVQNTLIRGSSCFVFEYQKEGSQTETTVLGFASRTDGSDLYATSNGGSSGDNDWNFVTVDIPSTWRDLNVQVGIIVRSLSTSDEQRTIKVKNFKIYTGKCEYV